LTKRKKKTTSGAGHAPAPLPDLPLDLFNQALEHLHLAETDVFHVREIEPGVLRIITRDARKFTYPEKEKPT